MPAASIFLSRLFQSVVARLLAMRFLIPGVLLLLMISVGMSLSLRELAATLRRLTWLAWLRMLLATFILPASIALILGHLFRLTRPELAGIFLVGVAPGAP